MNRQFFESNTIQPFKTYSTSFYEPNKNPNATQSATRIKRVTSHSTTRLNPQKFIKRDVFNNKLYSQKPFNIAVEFRKQTQQIKKIFSFDLSESAHKLKQTLSQQKSQQFSGTLKNLNHYFRSILKQVQADEQFNKISVNSVKKQLSSLKEGIEKMFRIFNKQLEYKQSKYLQLLFTQKAQVGGDYVQNQTLGNIYQTKFSLKQSRIKSSNNFTQKILLTNTKFPQEAFNSTSKSLQTQKKLKTLQQKLKLLQFQNKKHIIQIQKIHQQKSQKQKQISQLQNKLHQTQQKIQKVNQIQEFYEYKIKKLKQELEVAHIVKEQNIAEKLKYILQVAVIDENLNKEE